MKKQSKIYYSLQPGRIIGQIIQKTRPSGVFVLTDANTRQECYPLVADFLPEHCITTITPGEDQKNLQTCMSIWQDMTRAGLDRHGLAINIGGGVICDMGGFCAATFKRGIDFIHCPTSLLAQVDAAVGGKLGIDFHNYKNHLGLFKDPEFVVISNEFLKTLPEKELRSGYAEMIKHSLISGKDDWNRQIALDILKIPGQDDVIRSINIKSAIVAGDPKEKGLRKALNFGHTIGHALESVFLHDQDNTISHGEAVAIGIISESYLSQRYLGMNDSDLESICNYINKSYPRINLSGITREQFIKYLFQDKKNKSGIILATLIKKIGVYVTDVPVTPDACWDALRFYESVNSLFVQR